MTDEPKPAGEYPGLDDEQLANLRPVVWDSSNVEVWEVLARQRAEADPELYAAMVAPAPPLYPLDWMLS